MFKSLLNGNRYKAIGLFTVIVQLAVLLFMPGKAHSKLIIDGRPTEPDWESARVFKDFVVVDPLTYGTPRLPTEARLLSTPDGLAVAFICHQPSDEVRTRTITQRDAEDFDADAVSFMVDFDNSGDHAYEFSVSITGSYRDGTITNENDFNYDWDGLWEHAVYEAPEYWSVEMLIPWSIAAMKEGSGETRRIAVLFRREVNSNGEKYAFPGASAGLSRFISDFQAMAVPRYSAQEFDVWPYVTVMSDLVEDSISTKAGLDVFWKPSGAFQVAATFNPDFGQVESDDLVINFTAIETAYSDKRPFFTENQSIFIIPFPKSDSIFYTRRIGGASDKDGSPSDIIGAVKAIGSVGSLNYGMFAAQEDGDAGKEFYAGRIIYPGKAWSLGLLSTYVERPFLDRTALVNCIDYDVRPSASLRWFGNVTGSLVDAAGDRSDGYGFYSQVEYTPNDQWIYEADLVHFPGSLEINDMGYMERNNFEKLYTSVNYTQTNFAETSPFASIDWTVKRKAQKTTDGLHLTDYYALLQEQKMRSGAVLSFELGYNTAGYDDLISRGNGRVHLNGWWNGIASYSTPKRGAWRQSYKLRVFSEGYEDSAITFTTDVTWYPYETLNLDFTLEPTLSRDWLIWLEDDLLASYSRSKISAGVKVNWFPAEKHEIRLNAQWLTIDATAGQCYRIGPRGRLVKSDDRVEDFAMVNFGVQFRYRYEIAPLSDFYLVYSRGGLERIDDPSQSTLDLLGDSTSLRNSDQILAKLRYRF